MVSFEYLLYSISRDVITSCTFRIGLNSAKFSTHSCRAGGATDLALTPDLSGVISKAQKDFIQNLQNDMSNQTK